MFARMIDRLSGSALGSKPALSTLILWLGLASAVVGSAWAAPIFSAARSTDLASAPFSAAVGDLNNDGNLDVAIVHLFYSNTVSVLLGNGDGSLQTGVDYPTNPSPASVAIGDLNGDGKADLAVGNLTLGDPSVGTVTIMLGNGDGTFQPNSYPATGNGNRSVAIGDLNGDGKPDIVTANWLDGTTSVLLNNGSGSFQQKVDYNTGAGPYSVAVGDVSGDGTPDIVTANQGGGSLSVLLGNGNGTF